MQAEDRAMMAQGVGSSWARGRGFPSGPLTTAGTLRWDGLAAFPRVCSQTHRNDRQLPAVAGAKPHRRPRGPFL